ncbi:MAG: hypothetical protein A3J65_04770 [Candidatus Buchananbacteria bacterium RIFCSPHIGHO2_02_FULL_45_11b]|uniref:SHS2 domain-containing protein n=3 Tax=Candidatus Buchananiibacteriota TaxID=1817903 RepID=A0A1G1Y597_9BACT|nr:MAG: hypothetical protein A2663_02665 [Candidatus Buchananbacteria bacterium RIFCSPHIGHO2_01_FULL_46_12]OGY52667.1 MAG: hypothetical protein A3J65_04770 [Candidatus Buchananbacteria bacterium RIFCSPHIGHO2_02_FULL_45_11b]OGY52773.1 MAG: hypothetical protein A3B15_03575 [Candidatus Buchananbacteria bacterium RIFCSPLOWO2_01_FULL_45_31]
MNFFSNTSAFGLDIGERAIKLAQLKKRGKKIILAAYNELALPPEIIVNGEIKQPDKFADLLKQLVKTAKGNKIAGKELIAVLPETKTLLKVIEMPLDGEKEILEIIKKEIVNHFPVSPEEIYFDWQVLKQTSEKIKLVIGAVPKTIADSYFSAIEKSGFTPIIFEIEAAAIARSLMAEADSQAKIIIDFGAVRSGLSVYDQKTLQFTASLPISGKKITETIAKTLNLDAKSAEKAKIVCGLDTKKCEGALLKILLKPIDELAARIKKAILFYKDNFPEGNQITEVILCGGGANFSQIDLVLSEKLKLPVKIGNPQLKITAKKLTLPNNKIMSYATAIGLALRAEQKEKLI